MLSPRTNQTNTIYLSSGVKSNELKTLLFVQMLVRSGDEHMCDICCFVFTFPTKGLQNLHSEFKETGETQQLV